ncbi:hypothetical protein PHMEG_00040234 [Phytophthora megakarya]|uniref:Integrase zinc-binding domain-containing protein n=1 Tax=Phytophthora megakarya TaxID=4795 RepID=A0A225UEB7_9STRA|nr:hypothetical protein PHMEG_00040234 [Phytophthora megakarya]
MSCTEGDDVYRKDNELWIPTGAKDLLQCVCIIAHCGLQRHRGGDSMLTHVGRLFHVPHLRSCVDKFLASCLRCHHVKGGAKPTDVKNGTWNFLYLGESYGDLQYLHLQVRLQLALSWIGTADLGFLGTG